MKVPREVEGYESVSDYYYGMLLAMKNGGDLSFVQNVVKDTWVM